MAAMETKPIRDLAVMRKMEATLDLADVAEQIMRQNLRRRHPGASEEEIERWLIDWLHTRPGAEHGDGVGRHVPWHKTQEQEREQE